MGTTRAPKLSPAKLKEAFVTDLAAAREAERAARAKETPYAFVLYGVEGGRAWLWPYVLTDEGLHQVAARYLKKGYHETIEEARDALRWSVADAPGVQRGREAELPNVEAVFVPHAEALGETEGYRVLAKSATEALKALDRRGTFGKGTARAKITLVIVTEDTEDDLSKPSAKALNPPAVFKRFERQTRVEGTFKSNDAIAVSPDGKRLYAAGSRNLSDEEDDDDDVNEIVALDLRGRRLERRWVFSFPTLGDSVNEMAVSGDGRSLFVVRGRIEGDDDDGLVMRFGRERDKPLAEYSVPKGGTFAVTADGSRCAVATSGKELVLLDGDTLRELGRREIGVQALSMHFCSRRDLLVGTERGIFRLDPEAGGPPQKVAEGSAHRFSVDGAGKLIAVSQWFDSGDRRGKPFGVRLLHLASLKLVRTFDVPGHRCVTVALSSDGKRIAFEAHDAASPRKHVVAFDVATGKEIGRRRSDFIQDLAFLRDNRTLAIGVSRVTKLEAVELWLPGREGDEGEKGTEARRSGRGRR